MTTITTVAGVPLRRYDLLHGGSEVVDLSLLAARTAVVLEALAAGATPTAADLEILNSMAQLLSDAAHAVQFFDSGGREGSPPRGALAAQVDAAIDAVLVDRTQPADPSALAQMLSEVAERLRTAKEPWSQGEATSLGGYFGGLSRSVLNQAGHVGEVTATL
jgi:hypothetical protein